MNVQQIRSRIPNCFINCWDIWRDKDATNWFTSSVVSGGMTRGLLGAYDPLFFRQSRKAALKEADLIILAGAVCDFRLDYGRSLSKKAMVREISFVLSIWFQLTCVLPTERISARLQCLVKRVTIFLYYYSLDSFMLPNFHIPTCRWWWWTALIISSH